MGHKTGISWAEMALGWMLYNKCFRPLRRNMWGHKRLDQKQIAELLQQQLSAGPQRFGIFSQTSLQRWLTRLSPITFLNDIGKVDWLWFGFKSRQRVVMFHLFGSLDIWGSQVSLALDTSSLFAVGWGRGKGTRNKALTSGLGIRIHCPDPRIVC